VGEPWQDARTLREWDDLCVRDAARDAGVDEAEARRLFREWDLELVDLLPHVGVDDLLGEAPGMMAELELLTLAELAGLAKVHRSTVYRHRDEHRFKVVYLGPRSPRVTRAEAERYLAGLSGYNVDVTSIEEARRDH
jgi:hypothetical protein